MVRSLHSAGGALGSATRSPVIAASTLRRTTQYKPFLSPGRQQLLPSARRETLTLAGCIFSNQTPCASILCRLRWRLLYHSRQVLSLSLSAHTHTFVSPGGQPRAARTCRRARGAGCSAKRATRDRMCASPWTSGRIRAHAIAQAIVHARRTARVPGLKALLGLDPPPADGRHKQEEHKASQHHRHPSRAERAVLLDH